MLVAALVGALFGVDSGRVMPLDPATLRPTARGEAIGAMRGPVAWSPDRRARDRGAAGGTRADRRRADGRHRAPTRRSWPGPGGAWSPWGATARVARDSRAHARRECGLGRRPGGRAEPRVAGVRRPRTVPCVRWPLPGVVHGGLAASSRAAYVADAGGVLEVTPDGAVTRRLATARRREGLGPVPDGRADRRHARRRRVRQGHPQPVRAAVRAAADRHPHAGPRARSTRAPRGSSSPAATSSSSATACASTRRTGSCASTRSRAATSPPRSAPRTPTCTSSAPSAAARARSTCAPARPGCSRRGSRTCCEVAAAARPSRSSRAAALSPPRRDPARRGPHWPGPVAFAAERDGSLDVFVRDGDRTRRLTRGQRDEFSPNWSGDRDRLPREPAARRRRRHLD